MGKTDEKKEKELLKAPKRRKDISSIDRPLNKNERKQFVSQGIISKEKAQEWINDILISELKVELDDIRGLYTNSLVKYRIFENNLRVRDFSLINCKLEYLDNRLYFRFSFRGDPDNEVYIENNVKCDIVLNHPRGLILIYCDGPVYWADGTRRYDQQFEKV